jgi:pimeloyl-ACP methyl ester carboxylesterase
MNEMTQPITGTEHWTSKDGGVKLFLWNKCAGDPAKSIGTLLFVHGSSMASQPTFDLQVLGRPDSSAMDHFARRGYDCWSVDMEGYGRSTKNRDNNAPISQGADDCYAAAAYIQKLRGKRPFLVYGISSGALRAAMFAERHPEMVARLALDAMVWTGEGSPTLEQRRKKLPEFIAKNRRPIDKAFIHSIFERDHPGTAEEKVIDAFADAVTALDDSVPTAAAGGEPGKDHRADADHARPMGRYRVDGGLVEVLRQAAQSRQTILGDGRHLARQLPAEELHGRLSHPGRIPRAAGAGVSRVIQPLVPGAAQHAVVRCRPGTRLLR